MEDASPRCLRGENGNSVMLAFSEMALSRPFHYLNYYYYYFYYYGRKNAHCRKWRKHYSY